MHTDIPDTLLVPGAEPVALTDQPPVAAPPTPDGGDQEAAAPDPEQDASAQDVNSADSPDVSGLEAAIREKEAQQLARESIHRRKRRVALLAVLFVVIMVPAIVLLLLLG